MKILVVSNMYPSAHHPVGGIFVHEQVKALRAAGADVRVVTGRPLWLSGRRPRHAFRLFRHELGERRRRPEWTSHDGVPLIEFPYFAGALARPWMYSWIYRSGLAARLAWIAADFPYDLVHSHTAFLDGRAAAAAAAHRSAPMVLTEHTGPFSIVTDKPLYRMHTLAGMKAADRIVAVSGALKKEIVTRLPEIVPTRIDVVPNGVDTRFFDPDREMPAAEEGLYGMSWPELLGRARQELILSDFIVGLREGFRRVGDRAVTGDDLAHIVELATLNGIGEGPLRDTPADGALPRPEAAETAEARIDVLWVGHLVSVKRVDRLLEGFAIARRRAPRLRLRILGGGELEQALRAQTKALGIEAFVAFLPSADRQGVRREMERADFLVISSETETFGVVGVEAMAMGLPVLATDCGGPAEYVTNGSYGERVGLSAEDIAIGLQRMASRIDGFDGERIRAHAVANFEFARIAERLLGIYSELLATQTARTARPH
ncbi:glycosyltransferase [Aureimonas leprariae]|nr:glycosyltransferase [Aureimonas leprariae]